MKIARFDHQSDQKIVEYQTCWICYILYISNLYLGEKLDLVIPQLKRILISSEPQFAV